MVSVKIIKPFVVVLHISDIPAIIQIVTSDIRKLHQWRIRLQHKQISHSRNSLRIHFMNQIIQNPVVLHKILCDSQKSYLIGKRPAHDGSMIVILCNEFLHLRDCIISATIHMHRDIGYLCPGYNALLIAKIIKVLIVLIVRKSYGIRTHGEDKLHILFVHLFCQSITHSCPVLMS